MFFARQEVLEHLHRLERLEKNLTPVRLRYVKLLRRLQSLRERWREINETQGTRVDALEITLETQVGKILTGMLMIFFVLI